jgi:Caspase domain
MTRVSGNGGAGGPKQPKALIAAVAALLLLLLSASPALAQKRIALVLGNAAYQNVTKLSNPIKDATAIAAMFKNAGFDWVSLREDLGVLELKQALREFSSAGQGLHVHHQLELARLLNRQLCGLGTLQNFGDERPQRPIGVEEVWPVRY